MKANISAVREEAQRPPILGVIQQHVELRKSGREYWGLCPFHAEKTPSFAVNPDKELFYCHGCHAGGDVFSFIQKIEGVDFKTAAQRLGCETYQPSPAQLETKRQAKAITAWKNATSRRLCDALREIGDQIRVCKLSRASAAIDPELVQHEAALIRRWAILCDLDDDLNDPKLVLELWAARKNVEHIVGQAA